MKKLLSLLLFTVIPISIFSQVTYDQVVNKKKKGNIKSYITNNGEHFEIGDTLTLGNPVSGDEYSAIRQDAKIAQYPLSQNANNTKVAIKRMNAQFGRLVVFTTKPTGFGFGLYIISLDRAIENGEIVTSYMSSDQALEELKKWKDKLELDLISKEEYEAKKKELSEFIK